MGKGTRGTCVMGVLEISTTRTRLLCAYVSLCVLVGMFSREITHPVFQESTYSEMDEVLVQTCGLATSQRVCGQVWRPRMNKRRDSDKGRYLPGVTTWGKNPGWHCPKPKIK